MITADSIIRRADEICWTADGFDGCLLEEFFDFGAFDDENERAETKKKELEKKIELNLLKQAKEVEAQKKLEAQNKIIALKKSNDLLIRLREEVHSLKEELHALQIDSINREKLREELDLVFSAMFLMAV